MSAPQKTVPVTMPVAPTPTPAASLRRIAAVLRVRAAALDALAAVADTTPPETPLYGMLLEIARFLGAQLDDSAP